MIVALVLLLAPGVFGEGDVELIVAPTVTVSFATELGRLYQVQRADGEAWEPVGDAVRGTGAQIARTLPAGAYRVVHPEGWAVIWRDEFDGDALDLTKWGYEVNNYGGGNDEKQAYRDDVKYCFVKDGNLHVAAYRDAHVTTDGKRQPYSSARIRTKGRFDFTYGRVEVRAKMPGGQGIWPAVWMLPTDSPYGGWAAGGEIDLLEHRGSDLNGMVSAIHYGGEWPRNRYVAHTHTFPDGEDATAFHTYALLWEPGRLTWSVDGVETRTRTADEWDTEAAPDDPNAPFDVPFHLLVNVAVDGGFFGGTGQTADNLPPAAFPQTLAVDYVRVSQRDRP